MSISNKKYRRLRFLGIAFGGLLVLTIAAIIAANLLSAKVVETGYGPASQVRNLVTAEITYAENDPDHGFTCSLSDLGKELIDAKLASGQKSGYQFVLQNCSSGEPGGPNTKFQITATPLSGETATQVFCSDDSGVVRMDLAGSREACLDHGSLAE
jgi:hypothetical protein